MTPDALLRISVFLADALVVGAAAWLLSCSGPHRARGSLETGLAFGWWTVALITGAGVLLGETGGFGPVGFLAVHLVVAATLGFWRRASLAADVAAARTWIAGVRAFLNRPGPEQGIAFALLIALAVLTAVGAMAEPVVFDALTYHLPRIGHWLQEGRIGVLATEDERMNFVAVLPDVFAAWWLGPTASGFRLTVLTQAVGGALLLGATIGLARCTGLSRCGALLSAGLLFGMANVVVQFTAAQTDLFTAGIFATAFYLWLVALRRGQVSVAGVAGAGLALGAKGTVFYFAPTAVVWVIWFAWRHRLGWATWGRVLAVAVLGIGLFAGPGFLRNGRTYGDPLGPKDQVSKHHRGIASLADLGDKLRWNLTSALAQTLEPHSQPAGLRSQSAALAGLLRDALPERDPHTLDQLGRRDALDAILGRTAADADVLSFGVVALLLFLGGSIHAATRWSQTDGRTMLVWAGGVGGFLLFFHVLHQWHHYEFRYLVLAAPWIAVVAAGAIEGLPPLYRRTAWAVAMLASLSVAWHVTLQTHQAGWRSVVAPHLTRDGFVERGWRQWATGLGGTLVLAVPEGRPVSAFFRRQPPGATFFFAHAGRDAESAEAFVRGQPGWVVVPAARFMGREGRVAGSVWLFEGDPASPFSLAAYRLLGDGETPSALLYANRRVRRGTDVESELRIRAPATGPVRLRLANPAAGARNFAVESVAGGSSGRLHAEATIDVALALPPGQVSTVRIVFGPPENNARDEPLPAVQLLGP